VSLTGTHWIVQASSFREQNRAERLVEQLKDKGLDAEVHRIGDWYTVRLMPHAERKEAERQLRQLKNLMGLNGLIKKIN
jgi:cell division septation protein DedD